MIPKYLKDLQLDVIFAGYTANIDACIQKSNKDEMIVDSESLKISGFVTSTFGQDEYLQNKFFTVKNPKHTEFSLLQIDNGTIKSNKTKKCDCAIISEEVMSFIEFKANAKSTEKKTIKKNYKKAMKQLKITMALMQNELAKLGKNLLTVRGVEAYACFRKGYPRFTNAESQYRVNFANETGVPLSFEPEKTL